MCDRAPERVNRLASPECVEIIIWCAPMCIVSRCLCLLIPFYTFYILSDMCSVNDLVIELSCRFVLDVMVNIYFDLFSVQKSVEGEMFKSLFQWVIATIMDLSMVSISLYSFEVSFFKSVSLIISSIILGDSSGL